MHLAIPSELDWSFQRVVAIVKFVLQNLWRWHEVVWTHNPSASGWDKLEQHWKLILI